VRGLCAICYLFVNSSQTLARMQEDRCQRTAIIPILIGEQIYH
jgi:hypothetical protein